MTRVAQAATVRGQPVRDERVHVVVQGLAFVALEQRRSAAAAARSTPGPEPVDLGGHVQRRARRVDSSQRTARSISRRISR